MALNETTSHYLDYSRAQREEFEAGHKAVNERIEKERVEKEAAEQAEGAE